MGNVDQARTWIPIAIALLTLVVGGGWLQYVLTRRRERRQRYRLLLKELRQFELILKDTGKHFHELIKDPTLQNLEGRPSELQKYFATLPVEDPRRMLWKIRIEQLRQDNRSGATLVNGLQTLRDDR